MHTYKWVGVGRSSTTQSGEIKAPSAAIARILLHKEHIQVRRLSRQWITHTTLSDHTRATFTTQLSTLIQSGVPLLSAFAILRTSLSDTRLLAVIDVIEVGLKRGLSLSASLKKCQDFDAFYLALVRLGEETGALDNALQKLAHYEHKKMFFKKALMQALFYPTIILITALVAMLIMLLFVIPSFEKVFASFHHALPWLTKALIALAHGLSNHFLLMSSTLLLMLVGIRRCYARYATFRYYYQRLLLRLPLIADYVQALQLSRLLFYFATLQRSGFPLLGGMALMIEMGTFLPYRQALIETKRKLQQGYPLWQSLAHANIFPVMMIQMIKIGEASGRLDDMLANSAVHYEATLATLLSQLEILLEPLLLLVLALLIGTMVIAMYWPIFSLGSIF